MSQNRSSVVMKAFKISPSRLFYVLCASTTLMSAAAGLYLYVIERGLALGAVFLPTAWATTAVLAIKQIGRPQEPNQ